MRYLDTFFTWFLVVFSGVPPPLRFAPARGRSLPGSLTARCYALPAAPSPSRHLTRETRIEGMRDGRSEGLLTGSLCILPPLRRLGLRGPRRLATRGGKTRIEGWRDGRSEGLSTGSLCISTASGGGKQGLKDGGRRSEDLLTGALHSPPFGGGRQNKE